MNDDRYSERQERHLEQPERYTVLTPRDVMDILGIGKNTAYALLNSGRLRAFRVGRSWKIAAEALEEFMLNTDQNLGCR
ncbi:MAG: helix-turn-helix domain-containing protein [Oscillibacter sp.]|nr:helix-turn-helix domain-containing protein [Oscillibacter sp.]